MAGYRHLEIVQDFEKYVKDKKASSRAYYRYLLSRLLRMFQYKNLPDTIPHEILDRYLMEFGIACITKVNDKLYVFSGNLGGTQDVYYRPTEFIIANPHIVTPDGQEFTANVKVFNNIGQPITTLPSEDPSLVDQPQPDTVGVLMRNDLDWVGLHPLIARYAYLMSENTLTLRTADVMLRVLALITAKTDSEKASALEYLKSIEKGELGVIGESAFHEGINLQSPPSNNGSYLTQFIEYQQYLKGSFFNEIGLSANYNMKREAIGTGESTLDTDAILPLCDNMLLSRREDLEKVNQLYNTDISVEFSSSWLENRIQILNQLKQLGQPMPTPFTNGFGGGEEQNNQDVNAEDKADDNAEDKADMNTDVKETEIGNEEGTETGTETVEETGDNEESRINDLSQDEEMTQLLEDIENGDVVVEQNPLVDQGGESNEDTEESTDDKADTTDN